MLNYLIYLESGIRNVVFSIRAFFFKMYLLFHGCKVGKGMICKSWPIFRNPPKGNLTLGDYVTIGYQITFDPADSGNIVIGDFVNLSQNILIASNRGVIIGSYTLVGENVSIRDSDHGIDQSEKICRQPLRTISIHIGEDAWIGAGSVILKGAKIGKGSVIGANSVVTSKSEVTDLHVYAGVPVKEIGKRKNLNTFPKNDSPCPESK